MTKIPKTDRPRGAVRGQAGELLEVVEESMWSTCFEFPPNLKGNALDLIITNIPQIVKKMMGEGQLGKSDHVVTVVKISVGKTAEDEYGRCQTWTGTERTRMPCRRNCRTLAGGRAWRI